MSRVRSLLLSAIPCAFVLSLGWACPFDGTLREYLWARFWSPFAKSADELKGGIERPKFSYAGMDPSRTAKPLEDLRSAYRKISDTLHGVDDEKQLSRLVAAARSSRALSPREREEVELIDAKIDLRLGSPEAAEPLRRSQRKLEQFLRKAQTAEFLSEARGWLARVYYLLGDQTAAGKIYLDELNRGNSNLSRQTLITSLHMTYGYDGGPQLVKRLDEYFDTAEHAAFAIRLVTNPDRQQDWYPRYGDPEPVSMRPVVPYSRVNGLLQQHRSLFATNVGARALGLLGMRAALSAGNPAAALQLASSIPAQASVRGEPDFQWMLASAYFLSKSYSGAERTLRQLFNSRKTADDYKAAAAYGLCGVYFKLGRQAEQIHYALWLKQNQESRTSGSYPTVIQDGSIYWAVSGWDLGLLLDAEASISAIQVYLNRYPNARGNEIVRYSLAVRLSRENRYREAAAIYESLRVPWRTARMFKLDTLYAADSIEAKYQMAKYLSENQERIYFNDKLWEYLQRYALYGKDDARFSRDERLHQIALERKLKDDQEELWRAYLILKQVVREAGPSEMGRKSARLGVQCLRRISDRFGREDEIRQDDVELSSWLLRSGKGRLP